MIPGHKQVKCGASGTARQNFGQVTCHKVTPGNPTDITVTYFRSFAVIWPKTQPAMFPSFQNPINSNEYGCGDPHPRMPRKKEEAWYWCCQNYTVCTVVSTMTPLMAQNLDDKAEITEANKSIQRRLTSEEKKRRSSQNIEEQSAQNKVIETAFRQEQTMEKCT